ncbi:MAG TPA: VWA domain-containing protein [Bauldia sp.]|nr:VWA domain-containing protein [Bauldia sp.]
MKRVFGILAGVVMLATAGAARADQAIIVLDASGSMWGQIAGEAKIAIARDTLGRVLQSVPENLELGLMAYGHRDKGSCADIELIVAPAAGTAAAISQAANALSPKGKTPISDAVRQAAENLRYTEEKATVILITDGIETCDADPCAVASELEEAGIDFTAHVVGFGLSSDEGQQVACLAENTGGKYIFADNAASLGEALTATVIETPPPPAEEPRPDKNLQVTSRPAPNAEPFTGAETIRYDVYKAIGGGDHEDAATETNYGGEGSLAEFALPAGNYVVIASKDLAMATAEVTVTEDKATALDVVFNAGFIEARAMATETEPSNDGGVRWDITDSTGDTDTSYGPTRRLLVEAGEATVAASLGTATATVPVVVEPGATVTVDVVLGSGQLVLRGKRSEEASDFDNGIRWDVTGSSGETVTTYGGEVTLDLAAGDYTVRASLGEAAAEVSVSVPAGKTVEKLVIVATGRVIAHALFAEGGPLVTQGPRFDVMESEPGADGERRTIATSYNDGASFDLPPGKYLLRASADIATAEVAFELKSGPPVEVSVVLNAGLLAVAAPGGDRLDLLSAEKDIYGEQKIVATGYGEDWSVTVPVGEYVLKVTKSDQSESTTPVSIKAGQRTEVTAN